MAPPESPCCACRCHVLPRPHLVVSCACLCPHLFLRTPARLEEVHPDGLSLPSSTLPIGPRPNIPRSQSHREILRGTQFSLNRCLKSGPVSSRGGPWCLDGNHSEGEVWLRIGWLSADIGE